MKQRDLRFFLLLFLSILVAPLVAPLPARSQEIPASSQGSFNYDEAWKVVDSLSLKGLARQASSEVEKIYKQARAERNDAMLVKAVIHRILFQSSLEEDAYVKIVESLQQDLEAADFPVRQMLHSLMAETYWNYYKRNRGRFFQRSSLSNTTGEDFRTWDFRQLLKTVVSHHKHSLDESEKQKQTSIEILDGVLEGDTLNRDLRPTFYDFMVQRAAGFYLNEESNLLPIQPEDSYLVDDPALFSEATAFTRISLETDDSLSLSLQGLQLLQDLTKFHLDDPDPAPLIVLELQRLQFVYQKSQLPGKDSLYIQALYTLLDRSVGTPIHTDVAHALAGKLVENDLPYLSVPRGRKAIYDQEGDDSLRYITAAAILQEAIRRYPESSGATNCRALLGRILDKELKVRAETVNYPGEPFRLLISYRNLSKAHLRVVKLWRNEVDSATFSNWGIRKPSRERALKLLRSKEAVLEYTYPLPAADDHSPHSAEARIDGLPLGHYAIIASETNDFKNDSTLLAYTLVQVSALGVFERDRRQQVELFVTDRKTGKPLEGANVQIYLRKGTYPSLKSFLERTLRTDAHGKAATRLPKDNVFDALVINGNDTLKAIEGDWIRENRTPQPREEIKRTVFFTDRKLYRPGQTVHFKGFMFLTGEKGRVWPNKKTKVRVSGTNGEEIVVLDYLSNEFGTFSGSFVLPDNILPGRVTIRNEHGINRVEVAEYKRPTFEVTLNRVEGVYRLDDSVTVSGKAMSFAGYPIDEASVAYTVTRTAQFGPMGRYIYPRPKPVQIARGKMTAGTDGTFRIVFKASARDTSQIYSYQISADVTGSAGETRSGSTTVAVGNRNLTIWTDMGDQISIKDSLRFGVSVRNLNGEAREADVSLKIQALVTPSYPLRNRLWETPDQFILGKADFREAFPYDIYHTEDDYRNWTPGPECLTTSLHIDSLGTLQLDGLRNCHPGYYLATVNAITPTGERSSAQYYFQLLGSEAGTPHTTDEFITMIKGGGHPGDTAEFLVGPAQAGYVLYEVQTGGKISQQRWIKTSGKQERVLLPLPASAITDGLAVQFTLIKENRIYSELHRIPVEMPKKELDLEMISFRDKARPGDKEKWTLRITAKPGQEQVMAEMAATLYDASLDAISPHSWPTYLFNSSIWPFNPTFSWSTGRFLNQSREAMLIEGPPPPAYDTREYEYLNDHGYSNYGATNRLYLNYLAELQKKREQEIDLQQWKEDNHRQSEKVSSGTYIRGIVTGDDGTPLPGATITLKGTTIGVTTNLKGEYQIKAPAGSVLVISYLGFRTREVSPGNRERLNILLEADESALDEVVVVGFGQKKRADMVGSVAYSGRSDNTDIRIRGITKPTPMAIPPPPLEGESDSNEPPVDLDKLVPRTNFAETAFFFPHLYNDGKDGTLSLEFVLPESITRWRMLGFAHTKDLMHGSIEKELVTTKEVTVSANAPRFLRVGDQMAFNATVVNLTAKPLKGRVKLILLDALTMEEVKSMFLGDSETKFQLAAHASTAVSWRIRVPEGLEAVTYRVLASAGDYTDGEEKTIPVLSDRILITETQPLQVEAGQTADFSISDFSGYRLPTAHPYRLTLEYTPNPAWYAVQSLPYLMEYPHECAEQLFSRFFANNLAATIAENSPRIKAIFDQWKEAGAGALTSQLEKNQELKTTLLEESPWVMQARNETERKQRIGLLFDLNHMQDQSRASLRKLSQMQLPDGSFPWFRGMQGSPFITRHILAGMGQLRHLNALPGKNSDFGDYDNLVRKALGYADGSFVLNYQRLLPEDAEGTKATSGSEKAMKAEISKTDHLNASIVHFLYMRSFYDEITPAEDTQEAIAFYLRQAEKYWQQRPVYQQGLLALALQRSGKAESAGKIVHSLLDRALTSAEKGMYWAQNRQGYFWDEAPVETQALLIEAFSEILTGQQVAAPVNNGSRTDWGTPADQGQPGSVDAKKIVEQMKKWLLFNKRTNNWETTKATVAACYALLLRGGDWLETPPEEGTITVGKKPLTALKPDLDREAGTGYLKTSWNAAEISPAFEEIRIANPGKVPSWGALYWQYFEKPENVPASGEGLTIRRTLYKEMSTETGPVLAPLNEREPLKPGDLVKVRLELAASRDYEFVHLKDLRAAALEPVDMLAGYRYRDGIGYYLAPRDASMNFFIGRLPRGTYVLEYDLRVTHTGTFSNGFAEVQCMYAPEFSARSEGRTLTVPVADEN